jgi:hypothetical protein
MVLKNSQCQWIWSINQNFGVSILPADSCKLEHINPRFTDINFKPKIDDQARFAAISRPRRVPRRPRQGEPGQRLCVECTGATQGTLQGLEATDNIMRLVAHSTHTHTHTHTHARTHASTRAHTRARMHKHAREHTRWHARGHTHAHGDNEACLRQHTYLYPLPYGTDTDFALRLPV